MVRTFEIKVTHLYFNQQRGCRSKNAYTSLHTIGQCIDRALSDGKSISFYECPSCHKFHLTKQTNAKG